MSAAPTLRKVARLDDFTALADGLLTRTGGVLGRLPIDTFASATDLAFQTYRIDELNNQVTTDYTTLLQVISNGDQSLIDMVNAETAARIAADVLETDVNASYATAATIAQSSKVTGDANPRWRRSADGKHEWGDGATTPDTNLYRAGANIIATDDTLWVPAVALTTGTGVIAADSLTAAGTTWARSKVTGDTVSRFNISADGKMQWGPGNAATDTTLSRQGVGILQGPTYFTAQATAASSAFRSSVVADTQDRLTVAADGKMQWGPGNATTDTTLYRSSASILKTDGKLIVGAKAGDSIALDVVGDGRVNTTRTTAGGFAFATQVTADPQVRFSVQADGGLAWGPGNAGADTTLARTAVGTLTLTTALVTNGNTSVGGNIIGSGSTSQVRLQTQNAATNNVLVAKVSGDANDRFQVDASGKHLWGDGTAVQDVDLFRISSLRLGTTSVFRSTRSLASSSTFESQVTADTTPRHLISADGGMAWGPGNAATDVSLIRSGVGVLQINNRLSITNGSVASAFSTIVSGDTNSRFAIDHGGLHSWGPGNAVIDTTLQRSAAGILQATNTQFRITVAAVGNTACTVLVTGEAVARLLVDGAGKCLWSDGTLAADTNLYRFQADRLATDDLFIANLGIAPKLKAGAPVDADWAVAPPNGTIVVDNTNSRLYCRIAGLWKSALLA